MRILDLLEQPQPAGRRYVDATPPALKVIRYLALPPDAAVVTTRPTTITGDASSITGQDTVIVLAGEDPELHDPLPEALEPLHDLPLGTQSLVLLGYDSGTLPLPQVLHALSNGRLQIRRVGALQYQHIKLGMLVERTDSVLPLPTYLRDGVAPGSDESAVRRMANEHALIDLARRSTHAQPEDDDIDQRRVQRRLDEVLTQVGELDKVRRAAVDAQNDAERRYAMVSGSTAYRLGEAVINAAKFPRSYGVRLPRRLLDLYKGRDASLGSAAAPTPPSQSQQKPDIVERQRFHSATAARMVPEADLCIAGVWRDATAAAVDVAATTGTLLPNDANGVFDRVQPDLLIIEAAAFRSGQPWAFVGTPVGVANERVLRGVLSAARASGVPSVFWANEYRHQAPGLAPIAELCDAVVGRIPGWGAEQDFDLGVDLGRFNPIALPTERRTVLHLTSGFDPLSISDQPRLLTDLRAAGSDLAIYRPDVTAADPVIPADLAKAFKHELRHDQLPAVLRHTRLSILGTGRPQWSTSPDSSEVLSALACGAHVLLDGPGTVPLLPGIHVRDEVHGHDDVLHVPARSPSEVREVLRSVYSTASTYARVRDLGNLMTGMGLATRPEVAILVASEGEETETVRKVLNQVHRPAEVVVAVNGEVDDVRDAWAEAVELGITVHAIRSDDARDLARAANTSLVHIWDATTDPHDQTVADLVVGSMCGAANAIGSKKDVGASFVADFDNLSVLADRQLLVRHGMDPAAWLATGNTFLGLRPLAGDQT